MSTDADPRIEVVTTGWPLVSLVACTQCGVLLWDADKHYKDDHPDYVKPGAVT